MIKRILILLFLASQIITAQSMQFGAVKGLFMSIGVGPRVPVADFAESHNLGVGGSVAFSYTDNQLLPVFFIGEIGFQHLPGKQSFYKPSNYSSISTNLITFHIGARHYYSPLVENIVLLMPVIEGGISAGYFETSHEFKIDSGVRDFVEDNIKVGFNIGVGVSMFLLDVMAYYNYFDARQYLSIDIRARIPVFVSY